MWECMGGDLGHNDVFEHKVLGKVYNWRNAYFINAYLKKEWVFNDSGFDLVSDSGSLMIF